MASTDAAPKLSKSYLSSSRWLMDHLIEVAREHPNQWVAVHNEKIIAADADLGVVKTAAQSQSTSDTVFHFVDDGSLIFAAIDDGCR